MNRDESSQPPKTNIFWTWKYPRLERGKTLLVTKPPVFGVQRPAVFSLTFGGVHFTNDISSREILGTPNYGTPIPILLPYHSHKNLLKYGNGMGSGHRKGVPSLGVPIPDLDPWISIPSSHPSDAKVLVGRYGATNQWCVQTEWTLGRLYLRLVPRSIGHEWMQGMKGWMEKRVKLVVNGCNGLRLL